MKVGDKLYCKNNFYLWFIAGNNYIITGFIGNYIYIRDKYGNDTPFDINVTYPESYLNYFYSEQEMRKIKLERIENESR